jgi:hypothetical protein
MALDGPRWLSTKTISPLFDGYHKKPGYDFWQIKRRNNLKNWIAGLRKIPG